ncbi:MAG: hypothetical protein J5688_03245 [Paludibacteraceae bacterium]|nr:hypothetical protein [Paludibacteraceae bacterium]
METQIKSLDDLKKDLRNPLSGLKQGDWVKIQNKFEQIARNLFEDFAIQCGEKQFRLAEIEFYYYKKGEWNEDWNKETYPRTNKQAGELFFHYSGIDLCFESHLVKEDNIEYNPEFGGILIRSLLDGNNILSGPSYCANIMLNACTDNLPKLVCAAHKNFNYHPAKRYNIPSDNQEKMKLKLCYYADAVDGEKLDWTKTSIRKEWDKKAERLKLVNRNYFNERKF